jgi:hypothetical protein
MLSAAQKALRLAGSFIYQNPIAQYLDRPSRENPFAYRGNSLIEGSFTVMFRLWVLDRMSYHLQKEIILQSILVTDVIYPILGFCTLRQGRDVRIHKSKRRRVGMENYNKSKRRLGVKG